VDSEEVWSSVDEYIEGMLIAHDLVLEAAIEKSAAAGLPEIAVTPSQGKLLYLFARMQGAKRILEIGTLGGYSTIWMARALGAGGRLISIEAEEKHRRVAEANIKHAGLAAVCDLRLGRGVDVLPKIEAEGGDAFDLIFIDADKPSNPEYFAWALRLSRPGTAIVIDNVVREGEVADAASTDPAVLGTRRMNELIAAEKRVSATTIQTVGGKGYDGFTLALVLE
jgi:predicted O-methyltransferase YrrM